MSNLSTCSSTTPPISASSSVRPRTRSSCMLPPCPPSRALPCSISMAKVTKTGRSPFGASSERYVEAIILIRYVEVIILFSWRSAIEIQKEYHSCFWGGLVLLLLLILGRQGAEQQSAAMIGAAAGPRVVSCQATICC